MQPNNVAPHTATAGRTLGQTLRAALMASGAGLGMIAMAMPAQAQDQSAPSSTASGSAAQEAPVQSIIITGSRIATRDYTANSPIVTVSDKLLTDTSTSAIETSLNKLPQYTPSQTPALGGDIQPTATNTPGAATISLRGLGANRSLTLIDGRRATPGNANMTVDINSIPSAAIERVEVITGGASATYGADAVAGVTNFILKKDFQGLELDGNMSISQRGDGREYSLNGIMGTNFADGRGNISIAFSTNDREGSLRVNRPWFQSYFKNPNIDGDTFFTDFPFYSPGINPPSQASLDAVFAGRDTTQYPHYPQTSNVQFNKDGTAFGGFNFANTSAAGAYAFNEDTTGLQYKVNANGTLGSSFLDDYINFPLNRWNFFTRGSYDINDWISVFAQGYFNKTHTQTVQQPSPSVNGWAVNVPLDGRAIPADLATLLSSRTATVIPATGTPGTPGYVPAQTIGGPDAPYTLNTNLGFMGNRINISDVNTYSMLAGLKGKIPGTDWTWEVYGSQGESETSVIQTGFASLQRYTALLTAPDWGKGFNSAASGYGNAAFGGFGASTATCTSGINPFDPNLVVSQDCKDAINANIQVRQVMQQTVWEGDAQGGLLDLPAGQLRASVGASYRQNRFNFSNDTLTTQGESFIDQAIGLYPSGNSGGVIRSTDIYGELLIPILSDLPLVKKLSVNLGARESDYNTTGSNFTWKAMGDWQVTNWLRFRGGFNKAVRAPNIGELFLAPQQTFAVSNYGDICSLGNTQPYSANPTTNPTNAAGVEALCRTLMNRAGAGSADAFYNSTAAHANGFSFVFPTTKGNPNLKPETAKTWTFGGVITSPSDAPMFRNMNLSVDYYNIKVTDAIGAQTPDSLQQQCFSTQFNPTLDPDSPYCAGVGRNAGNGVLGNLVGTYLNTGTIETSGIDAQFNWHFPAGPGTVSLSSNFNYLLHMKSTSLTGAIPMVDYAGTLGGYGENGLDGGYYRWKLFSTLGYTVGAVGVNLQWQHLPSIKSATAAVNPATTFLGAPAYDLFNLSGNMKITRDASINIGVDNLFDKGPPIIESNTAPGPGQLSGGNIGGIAAGSLNYDILGRRFYVGAKFKF